VENALREKKLDEASGEEIQKLTEKLLEEQGKISGLEKKLKKSGNR